MTHKQFLLSSHSLMAIFVLSCCTSTFAFDVEEGFVSLFDGKSFSGWTGAIENYEVSKGVLSSKKGLYGGLYTKSEFTNFELRFEFRLTPGANNGIALRAPLEGDPAYVGFESQILDNTSEMYTSLKPYQYHGSIYGIAPAKRGFLRPLGDWNEQTIICVGRKISVELNGTTIVDIDLDEVAPEGKTIDGKDHSGLMRTTGHIGLMGHDDVVDFRNIRIHEKARSENISMEGTEG